jgi:hypothetical protein
MTYSKYTMASTKSNRPALEGSAIEADIHF